MMQNRHRGRNGICPSFNWIRLGRMQCIGKILHIPNFADITLCTISLCWRMNIVYCAWESTFEIVQIKLTCTHTTHTKESCYAHIVECRFLQFLHKTTQLYIMKTDEGTKNSRKQWTPPKIIDLFISIPWIICVKIVGKK